MKVEKILSKIRFQEVKSVYPTMGGGCQAYCTHKADFKWGSCIGVGIGTGIGAGRGVS